MNSKIEFPPNHAGLIIPIKSYLVKFMAKSKPMEPFILKKTSCHFSAIIFDQVKKQYYKNQLIYDEGKYIPVTFAAPLSENKFTVDQETILRVNQNLKEMFDQQLIDMVTMTKEIGSKIYDNIKIFSEYYEINDDDLDFYTIIKMYYRARHPQESKRMIQEEMEHYEQMRLFA